MSHSADDISLRALIESATADRSQLALHRTRDAVETVIERLSDGTLRVASSEGEGWVVHAWIKQAILFYFGYRPMERMVAGSLEFHDKIPTMPAKDGVRVVPPGIIRRGAHVQRGAIVMPAFVNIGAFVGAGTMVDTWATVGSCAQIGRDVHLSGGVGIGGVLEPASARPVIIEDGVFVGSRCVIVEGVLVEREAVLGAGVVLTSSTAILDVTGSQVVEYRGRVPSRSVVIPGTRPKRYPAGEFQIPCALIVGQRSESTDRKTSLEGALREHGVAG